jgi:hypothetical protein
LIEEIQQRPSNKDQRTTTDEQRPTNNDLNPDDGLSPLLKASQLGKKKVSGLQESSGIRGMRNGTRAVGGRWWHATPSSSISNCSKNTEADHSEVKKIYKETVTPSSRILIEAGEKGKKNWRRCRETRRR